MRIRAKFEGREKVMARLRRIVPEAEEQMAQAQLEAAQDLAQRIQARAPRNTGDYARSIQGDRLANRPGQRFVGQGIKGQTKDPNATGIFAKFIWRFLEFGTVKMAARPSIFPTYRANKKRIRRKVANAVNKAVRKARRE